MHANERPPPSALVRVVVLLVSSVLAFALLELLVRMGYLGPDFHVVSEKNYRLSENPVLKYELVPGSPDRGSFISAAGLRDREFSNNRPSDVFRIVVSGDSVTYGFDVRQQETFSKQLERMLNTCVEAEEAGTRFEVLNLGISGFNITQSVERLRVLGLRFQPNLVIFAYALNDPQSFSLELAHLLAMEERARAGRERHIGEGLLRWLHHSRLFLVAKRVLVKPGDHSIRPLGSSRWETWDPDWRAAVQGGPRLEYFRSLHHSPQTWRRVERGFSDLRRMAERNGVPMILTIVPLYVRHHTPRYPFDDVHAKVAAEAARNGLHVIDLLPMFEAVERHSPKMLFRDPMHLNRYGHVVAAASMFKRLQKMRLIPGEAIDCERVANAPELDRWIDSVLRLL